MNVTLTTKQAARMKGCTLKYIYDLLAADRLPGAHKVGKRWVIPANAVPTVPEERARAEQAQN